MPPPVPPNRKPLDLDDDAPAAPRAHRKPHVGDVWNIAKWALVAFALILLLIAFVVEKPTLGVVLGALSFFLVALARLAQAEQHRYPI